MTQFALLDPKSIIVNRDQRQRSEVLDTSEIEESISRLGVLQPIVVRRNSPGSGEVGFEVGFCELVAGERRLKACLALGLDSIPVVYTSDLDPKTLKRIELEENLKRRDLYWKDQVRAVNEIHNLYLAEDPSWTLAQTARETGLEVWHLSDVTRVMRYMDDPRIANCTSLGQARSVLDRINERRATEAVAELFADIENLFAAEPKGNGNGKGEDNGITSIGAPPPPTGAPSITESSSEINTSVIENPSSLPSPIHPISIPHFISTASGKDTDPVLCEDFLSWAETYDGPKFNLIHCDFPYGVRLNDVHSLVEAEPYDNDPEIYWRLTYALCKNIDRIASYSSNMVFWFSMNYYCETIRTLREAGFHVRNHPLIWFHSDNKGTAPNRGTEPRRVYDTALLCTRGARPLLMQIANCSARPTAANPIHPTQKPEQMLQDFLRGLIDETTFFLDPTCGSGGALNAAEELGAKYVLGLDADPDFVRAANGNVRRARLLRRAHRLASTP